MTSTVFSDEANQAMKDHSAQCRCIDGDHTSEHGFVQPTVRAYMDNVIVRLLPRKTMTAGGLHIPDNAHGPNAKQTVLAEVVASGPGWRMKGGRGALVPNETKPGDVVLIDALAGQDYSLDLNVPRQNKGADWVDDRGQFRIVREDEIAGVVEEM